MKRLENKANDLVNNIFYFDRPWDMEQDRAPITMNPINWGNQRADPEWTYMLNRMEYLTDLSIYALISNNRVYSDKVSELIYNWIVQNSDLNQRYHRTLDTGIRLLSWSTAIQKLSINSLVISESIKLQAQYLKDNYRLKDDLSNWGLLQSIGVLACYKELDESLVEWWENKLYLQLELQITNDGFHWEHSIMYHNQILLGLCRLQELNDSLQLEGFIDILASATYYGCKPNYHQVQQNDSDDTDVRGLLAFAYKITQNKLYKFEIVDKRLTLLCFAENVKSNKLREHATAFKDTGLSLIRKNDLYLSTHNHPYGSSHSHLMWGHVNFYNQTDILIDPGRYSYMDCTIRKKLKSISSHNCAYNKSVYTEWIKNSWDTEANGFAVANDMYAQDNIFVTTSNFSIGGLITNRYAVLIGEELILLDDIIHNAEEIIEANLIFDNTVELDGNHLVNVNYKFLHNYQSITKLEQHGSKHYNQLETYEKIMFNSKETKLIYYICLLKVEFEFALVHSDKHSVAYQLTGNDESYLIYICPREVQIGSKVKSINGYSLYGKLVIINQKTKKRYQIKI